MLNPSAIPVVVVRAWRRLRVLLSLLVAGAALAACASKPPPSTEARPFDRAVQQAVDDLMVQTQKMPAFLARVESRLQQSRIVIDPLLDGTTGQQTEVTQAAQQRVVQRMQERFAQFTVSQVDSQAVAQAQYLLSGTLTRQADASAGRWQLALALTELKSGTVVAQSTARVTDEKLDTRPTAFYRDSPVSIRDRAVDGYIRTSQTPAGQQADTLYLQRLPTTAVLQEAIDAYAAGRWQEALARYEAAAQRPDGQQLRVYNGLYLTQMQLGRTADAERSFGQLARLGLEASKLSVKFLFRPGSTEFLSDSRISGVYPMWLRQIARQAAQMNGNCLLVTGHTSRTGSESVNERLSLQRATIVRTRLAAEAPSLARRLKEAGMGFRENIVGTGADDASDALDRRVEFKVEDCAASS
ncbi:OmpA family protein [uncultured Pseudacidovorax sp.]|uniref:Flagellar motor protein MotB n=1 Tax=Pseudacidovorax intermedius TaxID=433924 RepID=A0A147GM14_9BURK|nr:OmpA family protein [uncultured Pseudacidovorax sp.]KTT14474.1 flagellar motor protein MotB [Pseudacidovorax intermedius]